MDDSPEIRGATRSLAAAAMCEDCEQTYAVDGTGVPKTKTAFTCDDCGGAVEVFTRG